MIKLQYQHKLGLFCLFSTIGYKHSVQRILESDHILQN